MIRPDKSFYVPNESVSFHIVTAAPGKSVEVVITHLTETIEVLNAAVDNSPLKLSWNPPEIAPRGYGVDVRVLDEEGKTVASGSTAVDVLQHWTQMPRYGFLSEFPAGRDNLEETMSWLTRYHVNGLQFYDWQYRHDTLLPPSDEYADALGREMSLQTIARLIDAAHAHNIAAMPYTAIYGASKAFYLAHPDWALFYKPDHPFEFGDDFLIIMDPTPDSPWAEHLLQEFSHMLGKTAFDGIHIDQYGAPQNGFNNSGEVIKLEEEFPAFINRSADLVKRKRGEGGTVIFNAVGNWPVDTVAAADQDAVYIEVWEPYRSFIDLHRIVVNAQETGGGKPVIIAVYIPPVQIYNVRLANALIFASGGIHLELGEPGVMLADPYFPKFEVLDKAAQSVVQRYYDFLVRYENVLMLGTADVTEIRGQALSIEGITTEGRRSRNCVAVIVRRGAYFETFSLVNLVGIDTEYWDEPVTRAPARFHDLTVTVQLDKAVKRLWWASPDRDSLEAQLLDFDPHENPDGIAIDFQIPDLEYWNMIILEYAS